MGTLCTSRKQNQIHHPSLIKLVRIEMDEQPPPNEGQNFNSQILSLWFELSTLIGEFPNCFQTIKLHQLREATKAIILNSQKRSTKREQGILNDKILMQVIANQLYKVKAIYVEYIVNDEQFWNEYQDICKQLEEKVEKIQDLKNILNYPQSTRNHMTQSD